MTGAIESRHVGAHRSLAEVCLHASETKGNLTLPVTHADTLLLFVMPAKAGIALRPSCKRAKMPTTNALVEARLRAMLSEHSEQELSSAYGSRVTFSLRGHARAGARANGAQPMRGARAGRGGKGNVLYRPTTAGRLPQMPATKRPFKIAEHRRKFVGLAALPHHPIMLFNHGQHGVGGALAKKG